MLSMAHATNAATLRVQCCGPMLPHVAAGSCKQPARFRWHPMQPSAGCTTRRRNACCTPALITVDRCSNGSLMKRGPLCRQVPRSTCNSEPQQPGITAWTDIKHNVQLHRQRTAGLQALDARNWTAASSGAASTRISLSSLHAPVEGQHRAHLLSNPSARRHYAAHNDCCDGQRPFERSFRAPSVVRDVKRRCVSRTLGKLCMSAGHRNVCQQNRMRSRVTEALRHSHFSGTRIARQRTFACHRRATKRSLEAAETHDRMP
jgi:hypothetical protein